MASLLTPYLSFRDTARAAMEFYRDVLGGELEVHTFAEFGDADATFADLVMHAKLETPAGFTLMASDAPPGMAEFDAGSQITVSLSGDDDAELRGYWDGLSDGAKVGMPLERQVWGDVYGQLTDRFGISWMVNIASPQE
ncbi:VOC family protein [Nocardioides sp. GY 10113]|uniref:VOC family protein n=1 Tax=Nocardioides sp. GY 10113 TaxID=2569761 RepID=UPI0010A7F1A6|nr:VOC family protein [Nocardioides sp. GY 10113]TIC85102.1 VOC family protein [Nocardioides sp. GY 10113]